MEWKDLFTFLKWLKFGRNVLNLCKLKNAIGFSYSPMVKNRVYIIEHSGQISFDQNERNRVLEFLFPFGYKIFNPPTHSEEYFNDNIYSLGSCTNSYSANHVIPTIKNIRFPSIDEPFFRIKESVYRDNNETKYCFIYKKLNQQGRTVMMIAASDKDGTTSGLQFIEREYPDISKKHKNNSYCYFLTVKIIPSPREIRNKDLTDFVFEKAQ